MECKYQAGKYTKKEFEAELIETLWNVNTLILLDALGVEGINRNIVECKSFSSTVIFFPFPELIETLWNVNFLILLMILAQIKELIETLWNVNPYGKGIYFSTAQN